MNSYIALARTWRPRSFAEMTGQEHVLRALSNALDSGRVHHAFLFAGTRGVGKTTVARILAKCLNCERGTSATPCGECSSCREIDAGRSVDLIEVDAASRTKVDDTRELLDNVQYAPTRSRYKIYLIDEVHMLSVQSFNALLKTLEEPPPHVKFLLATTDPQKLPVTVLSRCLQFNLKRLSVALIRARLQHILDAEKIRYEPAALQLIAQAGDGSLRDALSLLDQLLAYGAGSALEAEARAMLGTVERDQVVRIAQLLAAADTRTLLDYVVTLDERAPDYAQLLEQLAALFERVALRQLVPEYEGDELHSEALLADLSGRIAAEDVQLYYQTAIIGRRDLPLAPDPGTGFRMTLIRMLAFRPPTASVATANPPSATAPAATSSSVTSAARLSARESATASPVPAASAKMRAAGATMPAAGATVPAAGATVPAAPQAAPAELAADWSAIIPQLDLQGAPRQLATQCALRSREGAIWRLALDPRSASLHTKALEEKLAQALSRHVGTPVRLEIELAATSLTTPARLQEQAEAARKAQARAAFDTDPTVGALRERFGATVLADSVRPIRQDEGSEP